MQKTADQSFTITPSSSVIAFLSVAQWHLLSRHETTHWGKYQNLHLSCSWTHKATLLSSVPGGPAGDRAGRMARGRRAPGVWHGDLSHMKDHLWKTWIMRKIQEFKAWLNCEGKDTGCMYTHIFAGHKGMHQSFSETSHFILQFWLQKGIKERWRWGHWLWLH